MDSVRLELAERGLDRTLSWIGRLDTKASFLFGVNVLLLSAAAHFAPNASWDSWGVRLAILAAGLQGVSLACVAASIFPRLKAPAQSLFYFGTVADQSKDSFLSDFRESKLEELCDDLLVQYHRNAEIAARKAGLIRRSYQTIFVSLLPWLPAVVFLSNGSPGG